MDTSARPGEREVFVFTRKYSIHSTLHVFDPAHVVELLVRHGDQPFLLGQLHSICYTKQKNKERYWSVHALSGDVYFNRDETILK